jgi:hypothetical protein
MQTRTPSNEGIGEDSLPALTRAVMCDALGSDHLWSTVLNAVRFVAQHERKPAVLRRLVVSLKIFDGNDDIKSLGNACLDRYAKQTMHAISSTVGTTANPLRTTESRGLKWAAYKDVVFTATTCFRSDDYRRLLDASLQALSGLHTLRPKTLRPAIVALLHQRLPQDTARAIILHPTAIDGIRRCRQETHLQALAVVAHYRISCRAFTWAVLGSLAPHLGKLTLHELGLVCMAATNTVYDDDAFSAAMEAAVQRRVEELADDPAYGGGGGGASQERPSTSFANE